MTKIEITSLLAQLTPSQVRSLRVVYHKRSSSGQSLYCFSSSLRSFDELREVLMTARRMRSYIKCVYLTYVDDDCMVRYEEFVDDDFFLCTSVSDFVDTLKR